MKRYLTAAELGALCRRLRLEAGHTQQQTAELLGLSHRNSVAHAEGSGQSRHHGTRLAIIACYAPDLCVDEVYAVEGPAEVFVEAS